MKWFVELKKEREQAVCMNNALNLVPERFVINLDDYDRLIAIAVYAEFGGRCWPTQFSDTPCCPLCQAMKGEKHKKIRFTDDTCPYSDEWVKP